MPKKDTAQAPLTPAVLHILLALSTGERHGYGIMKQVEADSQGKVKMGPGTLYGSMGRMMEAGLIRESDKRVDPEMDDERWFVHVNLKKDEQGAMAMLERPIEPYIVPLDHSELREYHNLRIAPAPERSEWRRIQAAIMRVLGDKKLGIG